MAKRLTTILLLLAFLLQSFSRTAIVAGFYANQSYIAKYLCENRSKPKLKCCGKCQLRKKLKQEDKNQEENPERKAEAKAEVFKPVSFPVFDTIYPEPSFIFHTVYYRAHYPQGSVTVPFRPPCPLAA